VLDRRSVGLGLTVLLEIKVGKHSRDNAAALSEALLAKPEVVSCHIVSGAADFQAEVAVPDLDAYQRLLTEKLLLMPMIEDIRSNFAIKTIKANAPLPLGHLT
jgi:Lrp/AsnC family leucine-responsive transcriptional regulator